MTKLFLFDLDGTLVSTGGAGLRALNRAFVELFGVWDAMKQVDPAGKTDPAIFRELVLKYLRRDLHPGEMKNISACYLSYLEKEMSGRTATVLTGVLDFVSTLASRPDTLIALGTGNLERGARLKLQNTGLSEFFTFGGFGSDAEDRADVLRTGHRRAQVHHGRQIPPESVFVIGDTRLDVAAARRAGFRAVGVASGQVSMVDLASSEPDFLLRDMSHGFSWLERLASAPVQA